MYNNRKFTDIIGSLLLIFCGLTCNTALADIKKVALTETEREWVDKHPDIYFSESPWPPLAIIRNNQFSGILADYLTEISNSTGLRFHYVPAQTWPEVLQKFEAGEIDIIPGSGDSHFEQNLGLMSQSFLNFPLTIITRKDAGYINRLSDLSDEIVSVPDAYTSHQFLKQNYPQLTIRVTSSVEESMAQVSSGEADIFLAHSAVAIYNINNTYTNLKVSGIAEFAFQHHILIQSEMKPLLSVINKALSKITEQRKRQIYDRWVSIEIETEVDYRIIYLIIMISGAVILLAFFFNWRLNYLVQERTTKLNKTLNLYSDNVIASKMDINGNILYASNALCRISGYQCHELLQQPYNFLAHGENPQSFHEERWNTIRSGKGWSGAIKKQTKTGNDYWVYETITPKRNKQNEIIAFNSIEQDITAHKDVELLSEEIEETQREVVFTMGAIGEKRCKETGHHVRRVAEYSRLLACHYGLDEAEAEIIKQASSLHDIGKIAISDQILNKPGKLSEAEFSTMQTHSELGYQMLKSSQRPILKAAAIIAYQHHEKFDGTGYPRQLVGGDIHIYGRIVALADVFDALGSCRSYKPAWQDDDIFALIKNEKGKHFDPVLVDLFFTFLPEFLAIRERFNDEAPVTG